MKRTYAHLMYNAIGLMASAPIFNLTEAQKKPITFNNRHNVRKRFRNKGYTGAQLRAIRARNGVGRPPAVNLARIAAGTYGHKQDKQETSTNDPFNFITS